MGGEIEAHRLLLGCQPLVQVPILLLRQARPRRERRIGTVEERSLRAREPGRAGKSKEDLGAVG